MDDGSDLTATTEETLEAFIAKADQLCASQYSAFVDYANSFEYLGETPAGDPFSPDYRQAVLAQYRRIANVDSYDIYTNESAQIQAAPPLDRDQFPFSTNDTKAAGLYLMGVGLVMREMSVPAGSYVIEYGAGWGHLATMLAQTGYDVTCIDAEAAFVDLINARGAQRELQLKAYRGYFGSRPDGDRPVDAVVFMEAFHHSLDHLEVVQNIHRMLRPGGELILAAEPVYPWQRFAWGVRGDGHSVWAVRKFKWMELGFETQYFIKMLTRCGFSVTRTHLEALGPFGLIYKGRKWDTPASIVPSLLTDEDAATWLQSPDEKVFKVSTGNSQLTIADLAGYNEVSLALRNLLPMQMRAVVTLGAVAKPIDIAPNSEVIVSLPIRRGCGPLRIMSNSGCPKSLGVNDDERHLGVALREISYT